MTYKILMQQKEYDDMFDNDETWNKEFDIPYKFREKVWHCRKKGKKYAVFESYIKGVWATNIVGVILDDEYHVGKDEFYKLFTNKDEAIDWCLKQNQKGKVKIYNLGY